MSKRKDDKTKPPKPKIEPDGVDSRRAARNVRLIRDKIAKALDDPDKREQIVRAVRSMMNEDHT